jgi:chromosome segregation ATPase
VELIKFKELDDKVRNLASEHSLLKKKNQELEELLINKELELEEASIKIRGLAEERNSIRTEVDSLLNLLQGVNAQS